MSPATINKELRCLRMTLRVAEDWEYISKVPKFMFQAVPRRKLTFVPKEHFAAMYNACHAAILPASIPNVTPETWWKAILCVAYMTGWRIGQIRELKWADVDLTAGVMLSRAEDNKGGDDVELPLHPVIVTHLKTLQASFDTHVFPWNEGYNQLWTEFKRIQGAAVLDDGSPLPKRGKFGRWYGFHDLRRGFATRNVGKFSLLDLQKLMQHKSLKTTQLYLEMGESIKKAVAEIDVPDVFGKADAG